MTTTETPSKTPLLDAQIKADRCRLYARKSTVTIGYLPTDTTGGHDDILALAISLNLQLGWDKFAVGFDRQDAPSPDHFAAPGKRVMLSWSGEVGTVKEWTPGLEYVVEWDRGVTTVCNKWEIQPAEQEG